MLVLIRPTVCYVKTLTQKAVKIQKITRTERMIGTGVIEIGTYSLQNMLLVLF